MSDCLRCQELEQEKRKLEERITREREQTLAVMNCAFGFIKDRKDQIDDILRKDMKEVN